MLFKRTEISLSPAPVYTAKPQHLAELKGMSQESKKNHVKQQQIENVFSIFTDLAELQNKG